MDPAPALRALWSLAQGDPQALSQVDFDLAGGSLPSVHRVGELAGATVAAQALAAAELWRLRGGKRQPVGIGLRHALAMFRSERYLLVDGAPPPETRDPLWGFHQAGDGRWIQLHTNFPHHRDGVLRVLGCANERAAVAAAIGRWKAEALEQALAEQGTPSAFVRTPQEWGATPQAQALQQMPLMEILRIGDAPPRGASRAGDARPGGVQAGTTASDYGLEAPRPLAGLRVLDLSRVIAAPVAARTLAGHGAQVLAIGAAHLPNIPVLVIDTGRGKRSAQLDLRDAAEHAQLLNLVDDCDVFLQAYRPGAMTSFGLAPEVLARRRPGIVYATLSAYGHQGPWAGRRGFDSLVQSASGIAWTEGAALAGDVAMVDGDTRDATVAKPSGMQALQTVSPGKLPCQALDHATGQLAAFGAMIALARRATEGGSWHVRVSLAQTGRWLQSMGLDARGLASHELDETETRAWRDESQGPFGLVSGIAPVEQMPLTPARFDRPPVPPGTDAPQWQPVNR